MKNKLIAWVEVSRLQFYPMAFIAYSLGTAAAWKISGKWNWSVYLVGYLVLFLIELGTILVNEYYDYQTDRLNQNFSPFNGGARVLVDGKLTFPEIRKGILIILVLIGMVGFLLIRLNHGGSPFLISLLILIGLFLGMGYTIPPLQFSYRGLGEIVVGLTHSFYLVLCGYLFQTGNGAGPLSWIVGIPLFFSILAANTLAGIPDRQADQAVSKRSFSVLLGSRHAVHLAACFTVLACITALIFWYFKLAQQAFGALTWVVLPHAVILLFSLFQFLQSNQYDRRINGIMTVSLSYIIWFGIIPLFSLLRN